ncbi:MAG: serine/threonine protein kinase [Anaerolineales bacterium]|nr:serine/threonine protein kinase [Anaerolineales bacterium]
MIKHNPGDVINNRYRVVALLNKGGFGAIYRAWDLNLAAPCALKHNIDDSPGAAEQFAREASFLANLRHPNLPRVLDHFTIPGQGQYLVMDYIPGEDLQEMLDNAGGPLPEAQVLGWIQQVMDALIYLHWQDPPVVHRDIKPANVRITPEGTAMLVDFGIAKRFQVDQRTSLGAQAATPGFSPAEQYSQAPTDERSDVYSLGATVYAALTGQTPPESIVLASGTALVPPSKINPRISPNVEATLLKAMAVTPEDRYQSMSEFKEAIFGDGEQDAAARVESAAPVLETVMVVNEPVAANAASSYPGGAPTVNASDYIPEGNIEPARNRKLGLVCGGIVALLILMLLCGVGSWYAYSYFSDTQAVDNHATDTQLAQEQEYMNQTRAALDFELGSLATQYAGQTAASQAPTETSLPEIPSATVEQVAVTDTPQASPTAEVSLDEVMITEWGMAYFAKLTGGCYEKPALCFKLNDNYRDTQSGVHASLISKEEILIDPSWPNPHLVFWTHSILPHKGQLDISANGDWSTLRQFDTKRVEWQENAIDLSMFKGKNIVIKFWSMVNGYPQSTWFLENLKIVPDYKP